MPFRKGKPEGTLILEGGTLRARLIREGDSLNGNRWTKAILEKIVQIAEGVPVNFYDMSKSGDGSFSAHWEQLRTKLPPAIQALLPERLPGAKVGVIRNPSLVTEQDGRAAVVADVELQEDSGWFRRIFDKFKAMGRMLGLSIHVPPDALESKPAPGGGVEPTGIARITGFDVVTYPSAGGGFVPVLESLLTEDRNMKELLKRVLRFVPEAKRANLKPPEGVETVAALVESHVGFCTDLFSAIGIKFDPATAKVALESLAAVPDPEPPKKDEPAPKKTDDKPALEGKDNGANKDLDELRAQIEKLNRTHGMGLIESALKTAELPAGLNEFAKKHLTAILESAGALETEQVNEFIAGLKKGLGKDQKPATLEGGGPVPLHVEMGFTSGEKACAALEALLEKRPFAEIEVNGKKERIPAFTGIRQAYIAMTGDIFCEGIDFFRKRLRRGGALECVDLAQMEIFGEFLARGGVLEAAGPVGTSHFPLILSNYMHKALVKQYGQMDLNWKLVGRAIPMSDFKAYRFMKFGEFADLADVSEGNPYNNFSNATTRDYPSDGEEVTMTLAKKGNLATFSFESIVNDDTNRFQMIPEKLARAAARTINKAVWNLLGSNSAIYDSVALAHASHANLLTTAASNSNVRTMRRGIRAQKDIDARERGRMVPDRMFAGSTVYEVLYELLYSPNKPILAGTDSNQASGTAKTLTAENQNIPNILRGEWGLRLFEVLVLDDISGAENDYWMACDPNQVDQILVGFFNGKEDPDLFVQDLQNIGSMFTNDQITYKCRHIFVPKVVDYRPFYGGIVP